MNFTRYICRKRMNFSHVPNIFRLALNKEDCVKIAVEHIKRGNVIAIPTDTIYGLAVDAQNSNAIEKLYSIKGRQSTKPIAICVHSVENIALWGQIDHLPKNLLRQLLPGPVTIVVNRTHSLNADLNPEVEKVAVRIPKHNFVNQLTCALRTPLALTSANKSNEISSITINEFSSLWPSLDAIFDDGRLGPMRSGSTIIDVSELGKYEILRRGSHLQETLEVLHKYKITEK